MSHEESPKWVDDLLKEIMASEGKPKASTSAREQQRARDIADFEAEYQAIRKGIRERGARAFIVAAASLAIATHSLHIATHTKWEPTEEESMPLVRLMSSLAGVLSEDEFLYLPAAYAALLLRRKE